MLCGAALLLAGCAWSPQAKRDEHLTAGKKLLQKKDYRRAILEFENAVQAMPADAEAHFELGLALAESGDVQNGYHYVRRAVELDPNLPHARLTLSQLKATARNLELVKEGQDELKKLAAASPTPEVLNTLALTQLKLGEAGDAIQTLQEAVKSSPPQLNSSILLAIAKLSRKDAAGAEEVLKQARQSAPNAPEPYIVLGEFYVGTGRQREAEPEFQKALRIDPGKWVALYDLALLQNAAGEKQQADANFKRLAESGEKLYASVHALFLFSNGRQNEAIVELEKLFKQDPGDRLTRTRLVSAYEAVNRIADAEQMLAQALKKDPRDTDALSQRAALFQASGKYADAEKDLNAVLHIQPDSTEAHYTLARLHKAQGQTLLEQQDLSDTLRLRPSFLTARIELAELLAARKDNKAALDALDQAPSDQRQSLPSLTERNWVLWASGDMAGLRKGIDQGLAKAKTPDLLIQDGLWQLRTGNFPAAQASLEDALKIAPADVRALQALYGSYVVRKAARTGVEKVREYASRQPKSAPTQEYLGMILLQNGDRDRARAAFTAAKAADPQFVKADFSLVQVDVLERKFDEARNRLRTLAADNHSSMAHLWLGIIERIEGHQASALNEFRRSVDADGQNAQALNNLAYLTSEYSNKPDEALAYAEKACELDPSQPDYADTLGWILYRKGLYPSAIRQIETAAAKRQTDALIRYHLAMAYAKSGDGQKGRATLEAAMKLNPKLPEAQMAANVVGASK